MNANLRDKYLRVPIQKVWFWQVLFLLFLFSVSVLVSHNFLFFCAVQISFCGSNCRLYRMQPRDCAFVLNFSLCKMVVKNQQIVVWCCAGPENMPWASSVLLVQARAVLEELPDN